MSVVMHMPSHRDKDTLRFKGKKINEFLVKFEYYAERARLTEREKCRNIRFYFSKKEKEVLDILEGYQNRNWSQLKKELESLYSSSRSPEDCRKKSKLKSNLCMSRGAKTILSPHRRQVFWRTIPRSPSPDMVAFLRWSPRAQVKPIRRCTSHGARIRQSQCRHHRRGFQKTIQRSQSQSVVICRIWR